MGTQLKANEMIKSQVEGRAFCTHFPNVSSRILVRSSLGPWALEVGSYFHSFHQNGSTFICFYMLESHIGFHLKKLAVESVQPAGPEQFSEAT